ncbi:MAG: hemerythrin domain-containing protein [Bacillota bacterium]
MDAKEILIAEHKPILLVLKAIRQLCSQIVEGAEVDTALFRQIIEFVRNYADKYHHMKEEDQLFNRMEGEMDQRLKDGPVLGMLVEHDLGRRFISKLAEALNRWDQGDKSAKLDVIANAIGYEQLLQEHIHKEDNVIYPLAWRQLAPETKESLNRLFAEIEADPENAAIRDKYVNFARELADRLGIATI